MFRNLTLSLCLVSAAASAQTITQSNFSWNPNLITVMAGITINVTFGSPHTFTQVSESTWNANGNSPLSGGFLFTTPGTHPLTLTVPGTYYYVCSPHAGSGMKGRIIVEVNTGVVENSAPVELYLAPNPVNDVLVVTADAARAKSISLIDMQGRTVLSQRLTGSDRIGISHLPEGQYVAVTMDAEGRMVEQRRLSIQH